MVRVGSDVGLVGRSSGRASVSHSSGSSRGLDQLGSEAALRLLVVVMVLGRGLAKLLLEWIWRRSSRGVFGSGFWCWTRLMLLLLLSLLLLGALSNGLESGFDWDGSKPPPRLGGLSHGGGRRKV